MQEKQRVAISLLKNVNLYSPIEEGLKDILVTAGKVVAILDRAEATETFPKEWPIEITDFHGATVIPGLVDSHAHITGGGGETGFSSQVPPVPLSEFSQVGVTTVVGVLGTDSTTRTVRNLLARVYGLREEGLSAYCWTGGYHLPLATLTESAKSDITFLEPVIGVGEFAISDHRSSQPTYQEVIRIASEAHVAGLMTGKAGVLHFHLGEGSRRLELIERALLETELPARTFNPTHVNRNAALFEASCDLLKYGGYIDLTAFPNGSEIAGVTAVDAIQMAIEESLPLDRITISSDGGGCLPCFNDHGDFQGLGFGRAKALLETLQQLLICGTPMISVLPMFTRNVAKLLRLKGKGEIKTGGDADLLILNEQYELTDVMIQGHWHKRNGEAIVVGTFE